MWLQVQTELFPGGRGARLEGMGTEGLAFEVISACSSGLYNTRMLTLWKLFFVIYDTLCTQEKQALNRQKPLHSADTQSYSTVHPSTHQRDFWDTHPGSPRQEPRSVRGGIQGPPPESLARTNPASSTNTFTSPCLSLAAAPASSALSLSATSFKPSPEASSSSTSWAAVFS